MCRYIRVFVLAALIGFIYSSEIEETKGKRHGRFLFDLLGYIHGFKIGKEYALQLAPLFVPTPIIVVPSYNQQQSISIQKGQTEENYQEMGSTIQTITTAAKLIDATTPPINDEPDSIRQPPKREIGKTNDIGHLRQQVTQDPNVTNSSEALNGTSTTPMSVKNASMTDTTTEPTAISNNTGGNYPAAVNSNFTINNLTLTTEAPKGNITTNSNVTMPQIEGVNTNGTNNSTEGEISWSRPILYPSSNPNGAYGVPYPYPAATYDNTFLNQLLLTTDMPTNAVFLPPNGDNRWQQFSSSKNDLDSAGFRPLAGLYYDGFLNNPLPKKNNWSPYF